MGSLPIRVHKPINQMLTITKVTICAVSACMLCLRLSGCVPAERLEPAYKGVLIVLLFILLRLLYKAAKELKEANHE